MTTPFPASISGKVEFAVNYKNKGNQCFSLNEYKKAIIEYSKGLSFLKGLPGRKEGLEGVSKIAMDSSLDEKITPELEVIVIDLEVILKTNIATCYIKLENGRKALDIIKEALKLKPVACKSLMRQSEAYLLLCDTDKAMIIIDEALLNNQNNNVIIDNSLQISLLKTKEKIKKQIKLENLKQKQSFGKIFKNDDHIESIVTNSNI